MATANGISFHFNEERHEYTENGVVRQSVTQILTSLGYSNYQVLEDMIPAVLENKRKIGKLVHKAIHYWNEGDLDEETQVNPYPVIRGRLAAYKKFEQDTGYKAVYNEGRQIGEVMGMRYGMAFDNIGQMRGRLPWIIVDIKNAAGQPQRAWALQLAGYAMGQKVLPAVPYRSFMRIALQLFDDGTYRAHSSGDPHSKIFSSNDYVVWQAALCVAIDMKNFGVKR